MAERDTHFLGFAKLLYQDICDELGDYFVISEDLNERQKQAFLTLIAPRAYDLLWHALTNISTVGLEHANLRIDIDQVIDEVPDLTAWPEQDKDEQDP